MASSNRLDQRGSTKLARHQQSLLLRVQLVREQKAIAIRPWSHTSVRTVNRKAIYLESNVKWQNMTKDYIISISSGHWCAAVDLGISILLLPPAVLHNQADKLTWAINSLRRKEWSSQRLLQPADFKLGRSNWQLLLLFDGLSDAMADYFQTWQVHPTKTSSTTWRTSSEPWAFLRSSTSFENQSRAKQRERKKLQTSSIFFHGQKPSSRTFNKSPLTWNASVSVTWISPSLSFGLFGNAGATSNINSRWKHPI